MSNHELIGTINSQTIRKIVKLILINASTLIVATDENYLSSTEHKSPASHDVWNLGKIIIVNAKLLNNPVN